MSEHLYKYLRTETFPTPFCAGCGHGILMGVILRAIDELKLDFKKMVFVSGIGCGAWIPSPHFKTDTLHTLHGRPVAYATGVKKANPELKVVVISGDGDLAAIGGNHLIHAARRNVGLTVICANNSIYGMTGGQLSPTTPKNTKTMTTVMGNPEEAFDLCKLVKACGAKYVARYTVFHTKPLIKAIKTALNTDGFSFIDVVSPCPTQYGRRNQLPTLYDMYAFIKNRLVHFDALKKYKKEELAEKIIIGEYRDED
ncbi:MAG: thiamine pyrophosphate-dependent enzyme [candidate division WOR-3 bacterium]|nr:thiamine pyrophosphate-dependent enzyme [candidate division WOR-3 bacterium]MCX7757420.1 thiamine pyrophosphate-dependent enzyme [candidate division WOR-3 bacterium]MDW7988169.1 thiamine pyrophosphate-dependent enzyme [candidate division WOR-3 bacterium]